MGDAGESSGIIIAQKANPRDSKVDRAPSRLWSDHELSGNNRISSGLPTIRSESVNATALIAN
jgi:hypothetical protein